MQEIQETLFEEITQEEIDNFFGKPEYKYEKIEMTKEEEKAFVEDFIKRVTVKTTSLNSISSINTTSTIQHNCIEQCPFNPSNPISKKETDPFEGSEIDMTEEEAEEFIKNFKMDFDTSKTKEKFSKSKPKVFKPKSIWSNSEIEEIINLIRKMHPEKIYNNTKENDSYIMFTTIGTKHVYGMKVYDATNPIKLKETLIQFPKENLGMTFNTFTSYKSKNKINSIFYVNNLVIDIDFKKAGYENSDQVMFFLENDFFRKELPEPNFIEIGNQMKLIYTLEEPIKISKKSSGIKLFLKVVMNKLASKLKDFGADNIGINYYIRVPGSINTKNNSVVTIQKYSDYKWNLQDLVDEYIEELPTWYKTKQQLHLTINSKKKKQYFKSLNIRNKLILDDLDIIQSYYNSAEDCGHREILCFLHRNFCLLLGQTEEEALLSMLEFNKNFNMPLLEKQVISNTNNVNRKQYKYKNKTLLELLGLDEYDILKLRLQGITKGHKYTKEEKEEYNKKYYKEHKTQTKAFKRMEIIKKVILENKLKKVSNKAIRLMLDTKYKINLSLKSIEYHVHKLIETKQYTPI